MPSFGEVTPAKIFYINFSEQNYELLDKDMAQSKVSVQH